MTRLRNYWWLWREDPRYQPLPPISFSTWMSWGAAVPGTILLAVYLTWAILGAWR